jgi:hypothetical protein
LTFAVATLLLAVVAMIAYSTRHGAPWWVDAMAALRRE